MRQIDIIAASNSSVRTYFNRKYIDIGEVQTHASQGCQRSKARSFTSIEITGNSLQR